MSKGAAKMPDRGRCRWVGIYVVMALVLVGCSGISLEADAGPDFSVAVGESPEFNGCDSAGDIQRYEWTITDAPAASTSAIGMTLSADGGCSHIVDSMDVDDLGVWTIELVVTDSEGTSATDQVMISVTQ